MSEGKQLAELEVLAYRLLLHDLAAARREGLPGCIELQNLQEYFQQRWPTMAERLK